MPAAKYFIAIVIPEPFLSAIEEMKQELFSRYGLKGALRSPAHITLHRPFEWKEEQEKKLTERLLQFRSDKQPEITLKNFDVFSPRVVFVNVLKNELLESLHKDLTRRCKKELGLLNEAEDERGFHPHVTIAFRDLKKNRFAEVWEHFRNRKFDAEFKVDRLTLLKLGARWESHFEFRPFAHS